MIRFVKLVMSLSLCVCPPGPSPLLLLLKIYVSYITRTDFYPSEEYHEKLDER